MTITDIQDKIEQNTASGGFFYRAGKDLAWVVPEELQSTEKGLQIYLRALEYKSGTEIPEDGRELRRNSFVIYDRNVGIMLETVFTKDEILQE
ncbi:hypothetical protein HZA98_03575 [Candidatus Woesearchaeota archaeon]|nr:hypothetical protein [Candidatus Woesearchaeota archaeon]